MIKNILITGGAGFIGSHLAEFLVKQGYSVKVIDNLSTGSKSNLAEVLNDIEFIESDIRNTDVMYKYCNDVDCIIHLAAISSVALSINQPITCNEINLNATLNLLNIAAKTGIKKFIFASSCAVYGNPEKEVLVSESNKAFPLNPYAVTKLAAEKYCQVFTEIYNLPTISLRLFNVYGTKQSTVNDYSAVIPKFLGKLINNLPPTIYGDGLQTRDFVYINDVITAFSLVLETDQTGVYNIASGNSYSVNELFEVISSVLGKSIKPIYADPKPGEVRFSSANISLAQNKLKYYPKYTLTDGLKHMLDQTVQIERLFSLY